MSFFRTLMVGGVVDAATRPVRYSWLKWLSIVLGVSGVVFLVVAPSVSTLQLGGGLLVLISLFGFLCYGMAAKLYGWIAVSMLSGLALLIWLMVRMIGK